MMTRIGPVLQDEVTVLGVKGEECHIQGARGGEVTAESPHDDPVVLDVYTEVFGVGSVVESVCAADGGK